MACEKGLDFLPFGPAIPSLSGVWRQPFFFYGLGQVRLLGTGVVRWTGDLEVFLDLDLC